MCLSVCLFYSRFPCVWVSPIIHHSAVRQRFPPSLRVVAFSVHFAPSFAFLMFLFRLSPHLSCGLPLYRQHPCLFVSDIFANLSSFILTMCPTHFIRFLSSLPNMQALVQTSSVSPAFSFSPLSLHLLFS